MNTLGSHPGAILFRFSMLAILIVILIGTFISYVEKSQETVEQAAILQTKRVINSALAVIFSTYAVKGRLNDIGELDGGNPFEFLDGYDILTSAYQGEIDTELNPDMVPGWYYQTHLGRTAYKSRFIPANVYFTVVLEFDDVNQSGQFEPKQDVFRYLQFVEVGNT